MTGLTDIDRILHSETMSANSRELAIARNTITQLYPRMSSDRVEEAAKLHILQHYYGVGPSAAATALGCKKSFAYHMSTDVRKKMVGHGIQNDEVTHPDLKFSHMSHVLLGMRGRPIACPKSVLELFPGTGGCTRAFKALLPKGSTLKGFPEYTYDERTKGPDYRDVLEWELSAGNKYDIVDADPFLCAEAVYHVINALPRLLYKRNGSGLAFLTYPAWLRRCSPKLLEMYSLEAYPRAVRKNHWPLGHDIIPRLINDRAKENGFSGADVVHTAIMNPDAKGVKVLRSAIRFR